MQLDVGLGLALGFFVGITLHEFMQHRVAVALGDKTPRLMGRLTLSIKPHVDPLGTLIMPAVFIMAGIFANPFQPMFGWGKRHALNPSMLRNPKRDVIIVALAGPITNLVLSGVAGRVAVGMDRAGAAFQIVLWFAFVNLFIAIIEILPMPGRDGGRILARFLSPSAAQKMEDLAQYEALFLLAIFLILGSIVNGIVGVVCDPLWGVNC